MRIYLGFDGGGTKTAACILDDSRREIGRGAGGPCNIATGGLDSLRESVLTAASQALESAGLSADTRLESVCAGVAGYTAKRRRAEFFHLLAESIAAHRHRLEPDFVIAWWGATEGRPGIIVSAGTGAVVYGRNEAGESCRRDGLGYLLGDHGSAFFIGRMALQRSLSGAADDAFVTAIYGAIGACDSEDVIEWVYRDLQPAKIAALTHVVGKLAGEQNTTAVEILNFAATALRTSAEGVISRLQLPSTTPVFTAGSLWQLGPTFVERFRRRNPKFGILAEATIAPPLHDAAYGAALLAMQEKQADGDA